MAYIGLRKPIIGKMEESGTYAETVCAGKSNWSAGNAKLCGGIPLRRLMRSQSMTRRSVMQK